MVVMVMKNLSIILLVCVSAILTANIFDQTKARASCEITLIPSGYELITARINEAINKCSKEKGGTVRFTPGVYYTGTVQLKSNITLVIEKGAIIRGSDKYSDYSNDAFFFGKDLNDINIKGEGIIDGVDCFNPQGEEGFRGPHCIRLINCKKIGLEGFTIKNSANWAINCRNCSFGNVTNVTIRGGHDGLHTRFCKDFIIKRCDFRTGDDAFAGNDNQDFFISDCLINTSCNGFRMGCLNLKVQRCKLWGPGEYMHKIQKRNNMLTAFVHFSPADEKPKLQSGHWIIRDVNVENVDHFYMYNYKNGLWQTGQPVTSVSFEKVRANGILSAFYISGDTGRLFSMNLYKCRFSFRDGSEYEGSSFEGAKLASSDFFHADNFNHISLINVNFSKKNSAVMLGCESGDMIALKKVNFNSCSLLNPYIFKNINYAELSGLKLNGLKLN
ncbi:MAG TPA: hypothetical protein DEO60_06435 [Bacteroidales bacterium]|nr:hypothetical protein [Bacteroidales bacterium]